MHESQSTFYFEAKVFYFKVSHKNLHVATLLFHLSYLSRVGKFLGTRGGLVVAEAGAGK